jgi:hypothetical protein
MLRITRKWKEIKHDERTLWWRHKAYTNTSGGVPMESYYLDRNVADRRRTEATLTHIKIYRNSPTTWKIKLPHMLFMSYRTKCWVQQIYFVRIVTERGSGVRANNYNPPTKSTSDDWLLAFAQSMEIRRSKWTAMVETWKQKELDLIFVPCWCTYQPTTIVFNKLRKKWYDTSFKRTNRSPYLSLCHNVQWYDTIPGTWYFSKERIDLPIYHVTIS